MMIYLDNAATTRVFDCAADAARVAMLNGYYNPNATYSQGVKARSDIERERKALAALIGAQPDEIFYTSCATESNNWVLSCGRKNKKGNVVISAGEHASVYEPAMHLKASGVDVRTVPIGRDGTVDIAAFKAAVDKDTTLVSVIHVSNETGATNPIQQLVSITKETAPRALFHSDGVQALVKTGEGVSSLGVDLYSASAHKLGAPKGIGMLYIRRGVTLSPYFYGGGQENGARSGTQNSPYIAAFTAAAAEFKRRYDKESIAGIRTAIADRFTAHGFEIIGNGNNSCIMCVHIPQVKAEILQNAVNSNDIIIGKGSACSGSKRGNRVLSAMGLTQEQAECCIRLSFFVDTDRDEAIAAADAIISAADAIRSGHVR